MGCAASRNESEQVIPGCDTEQSTSANNAEDHLPLYDPTFAHKSLLVNSTDLRRSCSELICTSVRSTPVLSPYPSPDRALCLGGTREPDVNAVMFGTTYSSTAAAPVSHIRVPESESLKNSTSQINPLDMGELVHTTDQQSTLEWLQLHHNYQPPPSDEQQQRNHYQQQQQQIVHDLSRSGDGVSEHWSTRLSPTMRSETSLHQSTELGLGTNESVASDHVRDDEQDSQEQHQHQEELSEPHSELEHGRHSRTQNPTIIVIAPESTAASRTSSVAGSVTPEEIITLMSTVNQASPEAMHSPSRLHVLDQPYALLQPTLLEQAQDVGGLPDGDTDQ